MIDEAGKAEVRSIIVGEWQRDNWFVNDGLNAGEKVVVDGAQRLYQGATVQVMPAVSKDAAAPAAGT